MANRIKEITTNNLQIVPPIDVKCAVQMCIYMVATGQEIVREKNSSRSEKSQGISL